MRKLAPESVVVRPKNEKVEVVTAALLWNTPRHRPLVDEVVAWLKKQKARQTTR